MLSFFYGVHLLSDACIKGYYIKRAGSLQYLSVGFLPEYILQSLKRKQWALR